MKDNTKVLKRIYIMLAIIVMFIAVFLINYLAIKIGDISNYKESFFWLFSSSAQTIGAFVAFLITGYSFVYSIMDGQEDKDEGLIEINHEIKKGYYYQVRLLCWITGFTILYNILMLIVNQTSFIYKTQFTIMAVISIVITISFGLFFVIKIIDPDKYKKAAQKIIDKEFGLDITKNISGRGEFIELFIDLEMHLRRYIMDSDMKIEYHYINRVLGFNEMIQILKYSPKAEEFIKRLTEINRYRNLVVHGHTNTVNTDMLNNLKILKKEVETALQIKEEYHEVALDNK